MNEPSKDKYMVFDVESVGLHGEGFAVGFVVVDSLGKPLAEHCIFCNPDTAQGNDDGRDWVKTNCPELSGVKRISPIQVRNSFWSHYQIWKAQGAILVADCAWPVEARFLAQCIDDHAEQRQWEGPYPLHDLASILIAKGKDPLTKFPRLKTELPEHDPLNDARQSARILIEILTQ